MSWQSFRAVISLHFSLFKILEERCTKLTSTPEIAPFVFICSLHFLVQQYYQQIAVFPSQRSKTSIEEFLIP